MRSTQIADALLMLVTSRERAVTTVGDLLEESDGRGKFWFWSSVVRTTLAQLWRGLAAEPWHLARLAFRGVMLNFALWLAAFVSFVAGGSLIFVLLRAAGFVNENSAFFPRAAAGYFMVMGIAIQFLIGRWMARRAANNALGACLVFAAESAIAEAFSTAAFMIWIMRRFASIEQVSAAAREPVPMLDMLFPFGLAHVFWYCVPLVAGAWWTLRRVEPHSSSSLASG